MPEESKRPTLVALGLKLQKRKLDMSDINVGALDETSKALTKRYYPRNISQENRKDTKKGEEDHD